MLAHDEVWTAIDHLAEKNGLSPSGLARRSGLDPTTFNKSKRFAPDGRPRWPSTESIAKILKATKTSIGELFGFASEAMERTGQIAVPLIGEAHAGGDMVPYPSVEAVAPPRPPRIISFPDRRHDPLAALSVVGDSMLPLYRNGDVLFVCPTAEVRPGDRVVLKLKGGDVAVKVVKARQNDGVTVNGFGGSSDADHFVAAGDLEWMTRIVYVTQ